MEGRVRVGWVGELTGKFSVGKILSLSEHVFDEMALRRVFYRLEFLIQNDVYKPITNSGETTTCTKISCASGTLPIVTRTYYLTGQEVFLLFPIFCALIFLAPICTFRPSTVPFFALPPPSLRGMIL